MNLPDFFLADLPPEATLSPAMLSAACETLRRNRLKYLLPRSTDALVKILCDVAAAWLDPENQFRQFALRQGPAETGFSRAILAKGLDGFFGQFTAENFQALLVQDLGDAHRLDQFVAVAGGAPGRRAMVHGPEFLVHIAAGNLPNPTLMSLVLGLLTRSAQFVKAASGTAFLPRVFAHSLYQADPKLGACLEIAAWPGGQEGLEAILFAAADCVTVTGRDETVAAIRGRLPAKVRLLAHGQRVSFGYVAREVLREEEVAAVVSRAADDVIAWDQNGCLSPHVIYVEERGLVESDKFAALLAVELAGREAAAPRGNIPIEAAAAIASRRGIYEALAAHRADAKLWQSQNSTAWTVVFEHEVRFQFSCLNRFVYVKPVPEVAAVLPGVDAILGKISTVGVAAPADKAGELARQFARWGVTRICPLGAMQDPPLTWRHDGRPALGDLVTWTDFEVPCPPAGHGGVAGING
jgi:hypothetical protein